MSEFNPLLIHKDNTPLKTQVKILEKFDIETFDFGNSDLDTYISQIFLPKLQLKKFNILFIKDNLSDNYLELYGITLAYHIRLSAELGDKRFVPIVIISDVDGYILNKLTPMANILFTKNTFVARNEITSYDYFKKVFAKIQPFSDFKKEFLDLIHIDPPQDYLSHHDITNEWSIYRWAGFLKVDTVATKSNREKIEDMLYFKYLKALNTQKDSKTTSFNKPTKEGKILLIDDEWSKGWADVISKALKQDGIELGVFEYDFKDKTNDNLIMQLKDDQIDSADVIVLDLRLTQNDHENEDIDTYSGIKILEKIHEINAGIQVIMLTATSKSTILEKLYEKKILGYIKKEHPEDTSIDTVENINKFITLIDKGLGRRYLKDVFNTKQNISSILSDDIFVKYGLQKESYTIYWLKLKNESEYIFNIIDSDTSNKLPYAMLSIASSLESILSIFVKERQFDNLFWDNEEYISSKLEDKLNRLLTKFGLNDSLEFGILIKRRNDYLHANPSYVEVESKDIKTWFNLLEKVLITIKMPPNYLPYTKPQKKHVDFRKDKIRPN